MSCVSCGVSLPEPSPTSPAIRYCHDHYWAEQLRRFDAGECDDPWVAAWLTAPPRRDKGGNVIKSAAWRGVRHQP